MAAQKSPDCDGMRRCQRLPELTHPVDFARPRSHSSKDVPQQTGQILHFPRGIRPETGTALTSELDYLNNLLKMRRVSQQTTAGACGTKSEATE